MTHEIQIIVTGRAGARAGRNLLILNEEEMVRIGAKTNLDLAYWAEEILRAIAKGDYLIVKAPPKSK